MHEFAIFANTRATKQTPYKSVRRDTILANEGDISDLD